MPVQQNNYPPDFIPILSAGRHRTPRRGGCFMEFASYLAGEKWSDHPRCTHPALALLARLVNDCTPDRDRSELAELIPSVIGLNSADPRLELRIALRAALTALPVASEGRQRALAVGIISTRAQLAELEPFADSSLAGDIAAAFAQAPAVELWAKKFSAKYRMESHERAVTRMAESIIRTSVIGIAEACTPRASQRMATLLANAIDDCRGVADTGVTPMLVASRPRVGVRSRTRRGVASPSR